MASPLDLQFAFVTWPCFDDSQLPEKVEILEAFWISGPVPDHLPMTLVHGWLPKEGEYEFDLRVYRPDGKEIGTASRVSASFRKNRHHLYYCLHHIELLVEMSGLFHFEAICNGEAALRYPLQVWEQRQIN